MSFVAPRFDLKSAIGRAPEQLSLEEREALAGKWAALEIYTPKTLPLRKIQAIGDSARDCIEQLAARGLDPLQFEYTLLNQPYREPHAAIPASFRA